MCLYIQNYSLLEGNKSAESEKHTWRLPITEVQGDGDWIRMMEKQNTAMHWKDSGDLELFSFYI